MYRTDHFLVLPEDVIAFAWSAPLRDLAAMIGISDVGLRKLLAGRGIATPPRGYWAKLKAGRKVPAAPEPEPRGPGENGRIRLDGRFRGHVKEAARMPVEGPFATDNVPEDLEELLAQELKAIGKVTVPRELGRAHRGLHRILKKDEIRRQKHAASGYGWDRPEHDHPFALRQLGIANAILKALAKRGHDGELGASEAGYSLGAVIGDTGVELSIERSMKERLITRELRELLRSTPLAVRLGRGRKESGLEELTDTAGSKIEKQIGAIVAAIIVAGEAGFRQSLIDEAQFEEQRRKWKEEERIRKQEKIEQQRLSELKESGELLRQAAEIMALIEQVAEAVEQGRIETTAEELSEWKSWAHGYADKIDPVCSRQVLTHIRVLAKLD